ncbi:MAG: hypothetical protein J4N64_05215, partial [Chloroflexi bacterium]|nr:hypothetical protein [Chloroflexota bacterium]
GPPVDNGAVHRKGRGCEAALHAGRCPRIKLPKDQRIIGGPVRKPVANFPRNVKACGGLLIEVNTDETPLSAIADVVLRGPSREVLPHLVCCVMEMLCAAG